MLNLYSNNFYHICTYIQSGTYELLKAFSSSQSPGIAQENTVKRVIFKWFNLQKQMLAKHFKKIWKTQSLKLFKCAIHGNLFSKMAHDFRNFCKLSHSKITSYTDMPTHS